MSPDPEVYAKVRKWQNEVGAQFTLIPIEVAACKEGKAEETLVGRLIDLLGDKDLYKTDQPVQGLGFFGRETLLQDVYSALIGRQYVNLLGLRRLGKTSVIHQLTEINSRRGMVLVKADLQSVTAESLQNVPDYVLSGMVDRLQELRAEGDSSVWTGQLANTVGSSRSAAAIQQDIIRLVAKNRHLHFVIALDEIETAYAISKTNPEHVKSFFGLFRAAVQEVANRSTGNLSLMFSGVANDMFDHSTLGQGGEVDNPLFRQVSPFFVRPFTLDETSALLQGLGKPSLLKWTPTAIGHLYELTGGIPILVRELASRVRSSVYSRGEVRRVSDSIVVDENHVESAADYAWRRDAGQIWDGIVKALSIHYSAAALLLDPNYSEEDLETISREAREFGDAKDILKHLGIFDENSEIVRFTPSYLSLRGLRESPSSRAADSLLSQKDLQFVECAVRSAESETIEFKETARWCLREGSRQSYIEEAVLKTVVAFLNTGEGGHLFIGVGDDGRLMGLSRDLSLFRDKSIDEFERWLNKDLLGRHIGESLVSEHVSVNFPVIRGIRICWVSVRRSPTPAILPGGITYMRMGNQTLKVTADS